MPGPLESTDASLRRVEPDPSGVMLDIVIVTVVSGIAYLLEDLVIAAGFSAFSTESKGVLAVLAGAIAAVSVVLARGGSLADLGFRMPEHPARVPVQVMVILVAFIGAQALVPALVSPFIHMPEPDMSRYDSIAGNPGAAIAMALVLPLTASIPEEIIYRGFLIGHLLKILGNRSYGAFISVVVQAFVFSAVHFQWGAGGMLMTFSMGVVWGTAYLLCGRNLWVVILAHSTGHILLVVKLFFSTPVVV